MDTHEGVPAEMESQDPPGGTDPDTTINVGTQELAEGDQAHPPAVGNTQQLRPPSTEIEGDFGGADGRRFIRPKAKSRQPAPGTQTDWSGDPFALRFGDALYQGEIGRSRTHSRWITSILPPMSTLHIYNKTYLLTYA